MKKQTLLLVPLLTFIMAAPVFAQDYGSTASSAPSVPTARQERQQAREEKQTAIQNARATFQAKLATIKNAQKQAIVTRIDSLITQVNANRTSIMLNQLSRIENLLNRLETRANMAATSGQSIATVTTAITAARTAIATARTAVQAQAVKTYVINITTEANLGAAVSATRTQFAKDLQATHQTVLSARKAVVTVLQALAKVVGEKLETATGSATTK